MNEQLLFASVKKEEQMKEHEWGGSPYQDLAKDRNSVQKVVRK